MVGYLSMCEEYLFKEIGKLGINIINHDGDPIKNYKEFEDVIIPLLYTNNIPTTMTLGALYQACLELKLRNWDIYVSDLEFAYQEHFDIIENAQNIKRIIIERMGYGHLSSILLGRSE